MKTLHERRIHRLMFEFAMAMMFLDVLCDDDEGDQRKKRGFRQKVGCDVLDH
jgi:hypothetical protein